MADGQHVHYNIEEICFHCFHEENFDVEIPATAGEMGHNEDNFSLDFIVVPNEQLEESIHDFLVLDDLHDLILFAQCQIRVDPACIFSDLFSLAPK